MYLNPRQYKYSLSYFILILYPKSFMLYKRAVYNGPIILPLISNWEHNQCPCLFFNCNCINCWLINILRIISQTKKNCQENKWYACSFTILFRSAIVAQAVSVLFKEERFTRLEISDLLTNSLYFSFAKNMPLVSLL